MLFCEDQSGNLSPKLSNLYHYIAWSIAMLIWRDTFLWRWDQSGNFPKKLSNLYHYIAWSIAMLVWRDAWQMFSFRCLPPAGQATVFGIWLLDCDEKVRLVSERYNRTFWPLSQIGRVYIAVAKARIDEGGGGKKKKQRVPKHPSGYCVPATFLCQMVISLGEST